jgi:hypothetical protein
MKRALSILILLIFALSNLNSQESEKSWPYFLPIWGDKATERGFNIQLPFGLMSNNFYNS